MIYANIIKATFIERINRFVARCSVNGEISLVHVKNTGRCKELLMPGANVLLQEFKDTSRKTKYDLISVYKGERLVNMDSQAPNKVFYEWVKSGKFAPDVTLIKPECKYENSRFDFYIETVDRKIFVETKGVTLEQNGVVSFPDAPTDRGVKHLSELIKAVEQGYEAYAVFVIQMSGVDYFTPNDKTHKEFADMLRLAADKGVKVLAYDCKVGENSLEIEKSVDVKL
ncbi:MAG: DNA/RNA nuclease SfsA [Clostridia bacterium]|nr:DNA/RNA nuclease SfsA [Clostridia bacterium]